jgi:hypothetical protein
MIVSTLQEWPETPHKNNINTSKLAKISEDKPSITLVDIVDNTTQAKKLKENDNNSIEINLQNKVDMAETPKSKKTSKPKKSKKTTVKNQILPNEY